MNLEFSKKNLVIKIDSLFSFGKDSLFFHNLKCEFDYKIINFISGRNGIGKSTFFNVLCGKINSEIIGNIQIDNEIFDLSLSKDLEKLSFMSGLVTQNYNLMLADNFTVLENLQACRFNMYPGLNFPKTFYSYSDVLKEAEIDLNKVVSELSGGQKQILAITMILQKPIKILLLDEPTAALDESNAEMVIKFMEKIVKLYEIFIICISHDKELISSYSKEFYYEMKRNSKNERYIQKMTI